MRANWATAFVIGFADLPVGIIVHLAKWLDAGHSRHFSPGTSVDKREGFIDFYDSINQQEEMEEELEQFDKSGNDSELVVDMVQTIEPEPIMTTTPLLMFVKKYPIMWCGVYENFNVWLEVVVVVRLFQPIIFVFQYNFFFRFWLFWVV